MKYLAVIMIGLLSAAKTSPFPFDHYIDELRQHRVSPEVQQFARECGVVVRSESARYAISAGTWDMTSNLPGAVKQAETDFLSTAQVWGIQDRPRLLSLWSISLESEQNFLFCLDAGRRTRFIDATNWAFDDERSGKVRWIYRQRVEFKPDGNQRSKRGHFENAVGWQIPKPSLDPNYDRDYDFIPGEGDLALLKLPAALMR